MTPKQFPNNFPLVNKESNPNNTIFKNQIIQKNQYIFEASTLIPPLRVPTFCLKMAPHLWPIVGLDLEAIAPHLHHWCPRQIQKQEPAGQQKSSSAEFFSENKNIKHNQSENLF